MKKIVVILFGMALAVGAQASERKDLFNELRGLAERGNAETQYNLGMLYNNGIGTEQDLQKAFHWFKKSTEGGDPLGAYKLGCYYDGQGAGVVETDPDKALKYKLIAAEAGYSFAQHDVGLLFAAKKDLDNALNWWNAAADQGYLGSLYYLAYMYLKGDVAQQDVTQGYAYFLKIKKIYGDQTPQKVKTVLAPLLKAASVKEIESAKKIASNWTPQRTPLTRRALSGLDAAYNLVAAQEE